MMCFGLFLFFAVKMMVAAETPRTVLGLPEKHQRRGAFQHSAVWLDSSRHRGGERSTGEQHLKVNDSKQTKQNKKETGMTKGRERSSLSATVALGVPVVPVGTLGEPTLGRRRAVRIKG